MKFLTIAVLLFITVPAPAQKCPWGQSQAATVTAGVLIDWSLKQYEPSGFYGFGAHAGIWADPQSTVIPTIGVFAGYVESKLSDKAPATASGVITLAVRKSFVKDRLWLTGHFAADTKNYQDFGLRVGYDMWDNGIAVGAMASRTMHYGVSIMISMKH